MNKTVVYVGLGLLALYLLTRKKDVLKSAEVKQTLPPPVVGQPVEKPTQMPTITDFSLSDVSDYFKKDLFEGGSIPCANNPDKFYDPNVRYIMDPCRDYDKPSGADIFKGDDNTWDDFIIYN